MKTLINTTKHLLLIVLLSLLSQTTFGFNGDSDTIRLQLRWDHQFQFAGYYAAQWNDFYKDEGLYVEILSALKPEEEILSATEEVWKKRADFGIGAADILIANDKGADLMVTSVIFQQSAARFYLKEETSFNSISDILKLKVARNINDLIDIEFQAMLINEGLNPDSVQSVAHEQGLDHFLSDRAQMIPGYNLATIYLAKTLDIEIKEINPLTYGIDFYGDALFTSREFAEKNPEIVERFVRASIKGWYYAMQHSDEIAKKISTDFTTQTPLDDTYEFNLYQAQIVKKLMSYPIVEIGHVNPHRLERMSHFLKQMNLMENEMDVNKVIFNPEKLREENLKNKSKLFITLLIILMSALVIIFLWVYFLKKSVTQKTKEYQILNNELSKTKEEIEENYTKVQEQQVLFETMFNTIKEAVVITDTNREIVLANNGILTTFGYKPEEVIGIQTKLLYADNTEFIQTGKEVFNENVADNRNEYLTYYKRKNGDVFPGETFGAKLYNNQGEWIGNIGIMRDVSEREKHIADLQKEKEKAEDSATNLKLAQQIANIGNWQFDPAIGTPVWSDYVFKIYDRKPEDGLPHLDDYKTIYEPDQLEIFNKSITAAIKEGKSYDIALRLNLANKTKWIRAICQPDMNRKNESGYFLRGTIQDITLLKTTELELIKAKEKAEESDRLKTAFLQNMSHEIRTPLNAICGFSGMLNKPKITDDKRTSFVSIIQNSSDQLLSIVSDILTISSLETKQEKINISKVVINEIIVDLLAVFKQQTTNQNISLYVKQPLNDKRSEIYTDKTKITQILSNLLSNALKFTHEGFIEFGYNYVQTQGIASLEFYVKDSGIGIKPEFHEKIFERFRQADRSVNKLYGGTGLGLAISKSFTELLGGKIWVQSELEKGSTFYFTIPYKPVNEIDKKNTIITQNESNRTVLVAEDEEYNFLFLEELLINMDFKLIHAKDGQEVVEIVKTNPDIDLILMDIKMPIMTGHEAAKIIKELRPNMPIIAQSAYALEHEIQKYSGIFDDYLTKPIRENDLLEKVAKYIKRVEPV